MLRLLAAAAALALSGTLLTGCGSDGSTTAEDPTAATSSLASTPAAPESSSPAAPPVSTAGQSDPSGSAVPGQATATAFRTFARQGTGRPPVADQVDLYLGNAFTGFATRARASDPEAWGTCTELGEYAGRACPLSPLDVLAEHRAVAYVETPDSTCLQTYGPVPPDLRKLDRVSIVPAPGSVDSCIDDFAVQLFTTPDGELAAVSLLMGEP
ncbi:MAG: hypothetical protein HYU55_18720 [Nocardioides sp.]|nr:hypothetical protein [Nocardioides sp.]